MVKLLGCIDLGISDSLNNECNEPIFLSNGVFLAENEVRQEFEFSSVLAGDILEHSPTINPKFWQSSTDVFMHTDDFGFPPETPNTIAIPLFIHPDARIYLSYIDADDVNHEIRLETGRLILFNAKHQHGLIDRSTNLDDPDSQYYINWLIFDRACPLNKIILNPLIVKA